MLAFRNIQAVPDDPVETWGAEGVLTVLERGGLTHLRRLMRAALSDPGGPVAGWVLEAASCTDRAVAQLAADTVREARDPRVEVARRVREAIALSGGSLRRFAPACGTSPSRLSTYATGRTVPSADTLLRIERAARHPAST